MKCCFCLKITVRKDDHLTLAPAYDHSIALKHRRVFLFFFEKVSELCFFYSSSTISLRAAVAEPVDALDSGSSELMLVEVQVFLAASNIQNAYPELIGELWSKSYLLKISIPSLPQA